MKRSFRGIAALATVGLFAAGLATLTAAPANAAGGTTYYVDPGGNDNNSGTSTGSAWQSLNKVDAATFQPGDQILLKAGGTWNGTLRPGGSGNSSAPIVINSYGSGALPKIVGGGITGGAVQLYNQQYWEINGLEITNWNNTPGFQMGIYVYAKDYNGTLNHIYLRNNYVHDVNGSADFQTGDTQKRSGGITFATNQSTVRTKFDDIRIEGNNIYKVAGEGISIWQSENNSWHNRQSATDTNWFPDTNIQVRNNTIDGGGLANANFATLTSSSQHVLWEHNVVRNWVTSGLETWNSDDVTYQFNEITGIFNNAGITSDDDAMDADGRTTNITFQYNYIHDTASGFVMAPFGFSDKITFRYNTFENVRRGFYGGMGPGGTANIYNNTFYSTKVNQSFVSPNNNGGTTNVFNNIFQVNGGSWNDPAFTYNYNLFYNTTNTPNDPHKIIANPQLVNPGTGGTGAGLKIGSGSPVRNAGTLASPNGGRDFWGAGVSPLTAPNIGADNSYNTGGGAGGIIVNQSYSLTGVYSGRAIGTKGGSMADLTPAEVRTYNGAADQKWVVTNSGNTLTFTNASSGKVLEVAGGTGGDGAAVTLWGGNGGPNQRWAFTAAAGRFFLTNSEYGRAMETPGANIADGTPVDIWTPNGGSNQQWVLTPAP